MRWLQLLHCWCSPTCSRALRGQQRGRKHCYSSVLLHTHFPSQSVNSSQQPKKVLYVLGGCFSHLWTCRQLCLNLEHIFCLKFRHKPNKFRLFTSCGTEIPTSILSLYSTMHISVAPCDLFGSMQHVFCGTWQELLSSHAYRRHPQVAHGRCPGAGVWHGHCHGVRGHGHVTGPVWRETHKRNEKVRFKIPFLCSLFKFCKEMCIYFSGLKESPRSNPELHFKGVRSLASFYDKISVPYWHKCFVISSLISILRSVTGERRGHCDPAFSLTLYWLLQHCHLEYIPLHEVVCSTSAQSFNSLGLLALPVSMASDLASKGCSCSDWKCWHTHEQQQTDTMYFSTVFTKCSDQHLDQEQCHRKTGLTIIKLQEDHFGLTKNFYL